MGSISLPASGLVYVDSNIVIYSVEKQPRYFPALQFKTTSFLTNDRTFHSLAGLHAILLDDVGP